MRLALVVALSTATLPVAACAQAESAPPWIRLAGQAIPMLTRTNAVPGGTATTEARLVQPVLMLQAGALADRVQLDAMADLEGWTMPTGELTTGAYGEGFYDRRHPHTYVHELMLTLPDVLRDLGWPARVALAAGKGFAPFGTDDPMSRPPMLYPVNHHLTQVLERAVAVAAVRTARDRVTIEGGLFNGDEPAYPGESPNWSRFGDSWAVRLTVAPAADVEWQGSRAHVHSPEQRPGAGTDAEKWSTSLRVARGPGYGLLEWARTSEAGGLYVFHTLLAEGAWRVSRHRPYVRLERSERPEEERVADNQFRSARPHLDNSIVGATRWTIGTIGYGYVLPAASQRLTLQPSIELALAGVTRVGGGLFDPAVFYGRRRFYSLSFGVRIDWGMAGHRMGHYAGPPLAPGMAMPGMDHMSEGR
jgi:hypothetical protein